MQIQDFYSGFEGEAEFLFFLNEELRLRIWEGYLAAILEDLPAEAGQWTGLAFGWQEDAWGDEPWMPEELKVCLAQLESVTAIPERYESLATVALHVRDALVDLFKAATAEHASIRIQRD